MKQRKAVLVLQRHRRGQVARTRVRKLREEKKKKEDELKKKEEGEKAASGEGEKKGEAEGEENNTTVSSTDVFATIVGTVYT